jgi:hypothetical protein
LVCAAAVLVAARGIRAQPPAAFELALVDLDGSKKVLGRLTTESFAGYLL